MRSSCFIILHNTVYYHPPPNVLLHVLSHTFLSFCFFCMYLSFLHPLSLHHSQALPACMYPHLLTHARLVCSLHPLRMIDPPTPGDPYPTVSRTRPAKPASLAKGIRELGFQAKMGDSEESKEARSELSG